MRAMNTERFTPLTYALFRIVFGYIFLIFGLQKLGGWFGGPAATLMSLQGAAGVIETVGGLLIMIGLYTRAAAFLSSGEMAVAYFYVHVMQLGAPPMGPGGAEGTLIPQLNRGVDAALFCFAFLYISTRGAGILSIDRFISRFRGRK
jgi:putative oxidoreductase